MAELVQRWADSSRFTEETFKLIWHFKNELPPLDYLRPVEKYPIYGFIATQGIETMTEAILHLVPESTNQRFIEDLVKHWCRLACRSLNAEVHSTSSIDADELLRGEAPLQHRHKESLQKLLHAQPARGDLRKSLQQSSRRALPSSCTALPKL